MKKLYLILIVVCALAVSCQQELVEPQSNSVHSNAANAAVDNAAIESLTFYGPVQRLGDGTIRSYYKQSLDGTPLEIGIKISANGLQNLPAEHVDYTLILHPKAAVSGFTHVYVNWNPAGHFPPGVYDVPHFDVHFYIMSIEDRLAIGADDFAQFTNLPPAIYQPPLYFAIPGGEALMGTHWIDLLAPEFNGGIFTRTFIYGSYDGRLTFYEPMVTVETLLSNPNETIGIRVPAAFQEDGYHPLNYSISYSQKFREYSIAIGQLTQHTAQ